MSFPTPGTSAPPSVSARCQRRREQILETAIVLFARDGYSNLDLQLLADAVQVGKGTVYRYFNSKQDLFLAAVDRVMLKLCRHVDASVEGVADPLEQVRRGARAYIEYFSSHPEAVELLIQERAQFKDRKRPTYFEYRDANVGRWRAIYRDLIARGRLRPLPVEQISDVLGNLLYGTMFVNYLTKRDRPPDRQADEIIDVVFNGILSDAERDAPPQRGARRAKP